AAADEGYTITTRPRRDALVSQDRWAYGMHGYDNRLQSMGALFIAVGPAFASGQVVPRVRALDLYALMAEVLGLQAAPNDGSLDSIQVVLRR
ncbi:MAG TPA: hypothetical protein VLL51_02815, partial [Gemmatimonadales bacterium]|nr:hypothetical protein [Gemmatimonadales bacterium]